MRSNRVRLACCALLLSGCGATVASPRGAAQDVPPVADAGVVHDVAAVLPDVAVARDVGTVAPDVVSLPMNLPLGAPCERDGQCVSGVCAQTPGVAMGCAQPCNADPPCVSVNSNDACVLDRTPTGGRLVCGFVGVAMVDRAGACTADTDCISGFCLESLCRNACATDADCTAGWRCGPQAVGGSTVQVCRANPITRVTVEDYALGEGNYVTGRPTVPFGVVAPPDTVSLTWITQDLGGSDLYAANASITDPNGRSLVDLRSWNILTEQPIRTIAARYQVNVATFPGRDMEPMVPGLFESTHVLLNSSTGMPTATRRLRASVRVKRAPGGVAAPGWYVTLQIYLVGLPGVTAANAGSNARLRAAITRMQNIYANAGVGVTVRGYTDATDAARLSTIDTQDEFHALLQQSAGLTDDVLPIFLVQSISDTAGLEGAVGMAGAIDGPPGIYGTLQSGVMAGWDTTTNGANDILGQVLAHECGHYLGLWHTRENLPACTAAGQTMCSIWGGVDNLTDTPTGAGATSYLMYWSTDGRNIGISNAEAVMLRINPIVH